MACGAGLTVKEKSVRCLTSRLLMCGLCVGVAVLGSMRSAPAMAQAKLVQTPYQNPKVLMDIYLDDPAKMASALYWLRALVNPLTAAPYSMFPEDMHLIVLLHGTEIVTLARKNEERYQEVVQRMRYYAGMGVKFKVCGLALQDFHYTANDLYDFVEVTPSALTELMHWQNRGYALITPQVNDKRFSIEQIR